MPDEMEDPIRIVAALRARGVSFVVVGGLAAAAQGSTLATADVEVCLADDDENLQRLGLALEDLSAAQTPSEGDDDHRVTFTCAAGRLTCVEVPGSFPDLRARASEADLGRGVVVPVGAVEDLVDLARSSGDLESAARLASFADEPPIVLGSPEGAGSDEPRPTGKVWSALERVDSFLTDLDGRGVKRRKGS